MIDRADYFLKGYYCKTPVSFSFKELEIQIVPNPAKIDQEKKGFPTYAETGILSVSGSNDKVVLENIAVDIKNVLSIGLGNRVIFDRQSYWTGDDVENIERKMSKNGNSGEQIIPESEIHFFLAETLPKWSQLSLQEKNDIFIITDYLNQTKTDFVADRLLRTVQAWECAANYWIPEVSLTDDLKELRSRIKKTYQQWKSEKKYVDKDGELGKRITSPLDQEKLMIKLETLIADFGLKIDSINLNLKKLKKFRDEVAHTGRINTRSAEAVKYLHPGVMGLQLILLKKLGYNGLVYGEKDNWIIINNISEYFD
jgi:hypothetical protein